MSLVYVLRTFCYTPLKVISHIRDFMETLFNKPRVFLSHSKKNVEFIEKLAADLQKCQIDPWLDSVEIRHGKSWQDSIFEHGLPSCDAIIVYFTEESIQSNVVKKEIDVGLLSFLYTLTEQYHTLLSW